MAGSGDETEDGAPYLHPFPPTKRVDSLVRAEKETDQPPPDSGASRRQLSPAPGERHKLASPRSTERHRRYLGSSRSTERHSQSPQDQGTHAGPSDLASEAARAQRALDDANQTILRRKARRRRFDEISSRRRPLRGRRPWYRRGRTEPSPDPVASTAAGATAAPSPSTRPQGVAFQKPRPGDDALTRGSVVCMASAPRVELSAELAKAVVATAFALLKSEKQVLLHTEGLSVGAAWARTKIDPFYGHMRRAPTLALVKALRMAHDEALDPVLLPTPEESWRNVTGGKIDAATVVITGTATEGVAPGMARPSWGRR